MATDGPSEEKISLLDHADVLQTILSFVVIDYRDILVLKREFGCEHLKGADRALQAERPHDRGEDILKMAYKPTLCALRLVFDEKGLWQVKAVRNTMTDLRRASKHHRNEWNYAWLADKKVPKVGDYLNDLPREGLLPTCDFFEVNFADGPREERFLSWDKLRASLMEDIEAGRAFTVYWRLFCSIQANRDKVRIPFVAYDPNHLITNKRFWNTMF